MMCNGGEEVLLKNTRALDHGYVYTCFFIKKMDRGRCFESDCRYVFFKTHCTTHNICNLHNLYNSSSKNYVKLKHIFLYIPRVYCIYRHSYKKYIVEPVVL